MNGTPGARRPLVAGNWKMHETVAEARDLVRALLREDLPDGVDIVIAPPFTALQAVGELLRGSRIGLAGQTMHEGSQGPFTGEISPVMLRELGVRWVILGHSERRAQCGESDAAVGRKVRSALEHGLTPIVAVGETAEEHAAGRTIERVDAQLRAAFEGVLAADVGRCVVAYEPIWAIGSGTPDDPANSNAVMAHLRRAVPGLAGTRMLYGGSMKPENAAAFLAEPDIDGGLIGGASLKAASFAAIVNAARPRAGSL